MNRAQNSINAVTTMMKSNLGKIISNTQNLEDIENQSDRLAGTASKFR